MCRSQMQIALHKRKCHLMSKKRSHRCSHLPFTVWKLLHISSSNSCCLSCWNWLSWMFLIWYPEWVQTRSEQLELQPGRLEEAGSSGFFPLLFLIVTYIKFPISKGKMCWHLQYSFSRWRSLWVIWFFCDLEGKAIWLCLRQRCLLVQRVS